MSGITNLIGHTVRKIVEVDHKVEYERTLTYSQFCEELADVLYGKLACNYKTHIRWSDSNNYYGVHMPTVYDGNGVITRYKFSDYSDR